MVQGILSGIGGIWRVGTVTSCLCEQCAPHTLPSQETEVPGTGSLRVCRAGKDCWEFCLHPSCAAWSPHSLACFVPWQATSGDSGEETESNSYS